MGFKRPWVRLSPLGPNRGCQFQREKEPWNVSFTALSLYLGLSGRIKKSEPPVKRTRPACKDAKSPKEVCAKSAPYNGQNRELPIIPLQGVKRDTIYINGLGLNWQQNRKAAFPASYRKNRSAALSIYALCNRMVTAVFSAQVRAQDLTHSGPAIRKK